MNIHWNTRRVLRGAYIPFHHRCLPFLHASVSDDSLYTITHYLPPCLHACGLARAARALPFAAPMPTCLALTARVEDLATPTYTTRHGRRSRPIYTLHRVRGVRISAAGGVAAFYIPTARCAVVMSMVVDRMWILPRCHCRNTVALQHCGPLPRRDAWHAAPPARASRHTRLYRERTAIPHCRARCLPSMILMFAQLTTYLPPAHRAAYTTPATASCLPHSPPALRRAAYRCYALPRANRLTIYCPALYLAAGRWSSMIDNLRLPPGYE